MKSRKYIKENAENERTPRTLREFIGQKRKLFLLARRVLSSEGEKRLILCVGAALKSLKGEKDFRFSDIYGTVLSCVSSDEISGDGLRRALFSAETLYESRALLHLADFLYIAVCERIFETMTLSGEGDDEHERLLSQVGSIAQIDYSSLFFEFCDAARTLENDPVFPLCSEKTKSLYVSLLGKYAEKRGISEGEAAKAVLISARKRGVTADEILFEERKYPKKAYGLFLFATVLASTAIFALLLGNPSAAACLFLPVAVCLYDLYKQLAARLFMRFGGGELCRISSGEVLEREKCCIAVAALLRGEESDEALFSRLEDFYLRNRSKNYVFAVLGDLGESESEERDGDEAIIEYARARISSLNEKYGGGFALFIRRREYCFCQEKYLSRERKRGGVEELCRFIKGEKIDYREMIFDENLIGKIRYLLTLDVDTVLSFGAVRALLGIMLHPQNRARVDAEKGRVVRGYGIIQPTVICSLSSADKTRFSRLTSGDGGVDVYSGTGRELLQTVTGCGNFSGKGMIDIDAFLSVCGGVFPRERILSHDLPEGILSRCGVAADVVMCDSTPSGALSYYARLRRWIRGDLQSLLFIPKKITNAAGETINNPVGRGGKFRIADNILRHSASLCAVFSLAVALLFGARSFYVTALFALSFVFFGAAVRVFDFLFCGEKGDAPALFGAVYLLSALPYLAWIFISEGTKTAWRFAVTKRHFLDWTSAAQSEKLHGSVLGYYREMLPSALLGAAAILSPHVLSRLLGVLWIFFPALAFFLSSSKRKERQIGRGGRALIRESSLSAWRYFVDSVSEKTNFLPPDNLQLSPEERYAMRTSPTNIGMFLVSALCARDFGCITSEKLLFYVTKCGETLAKMLTWHGHFYNWYDVKTLEVVGEPFISSVDSGNLAVSLVTLCEGLKEYAFECTGLLDAVNTYREILGRMDFSILCDESRRLFYIGYNVKTGRFSESRYDVFMSEARLACYYAVASGQISAEYYYSPARKICSDGRTRGIYSWSGTCFEYFMPCLFLPTERNSVTEAGLSYAYAAQRRAAVCRNYHGRRVSLFGVSESQYFCFDGMMNYQYRAFGINSVALDPVSSGEEVISPYSSFLMMAMGSAATSNLKTLKSIGAYGKYGFYEAVDFCRGRVGEGYAVIKSYMAHHLGMSISACANACFDDILVKRFMRDPQMRSGGILLEERIAKGAKTWQIKEKKRVAEKPRIEGDVGFSVGKYEKTLLSPEVYMISNNKTRLIASSSGHIFMYDGRNCVFASERNVFALSGGLSLVAEVDGELFSAFPLGYTSEGFESRFDFSCDEKSIAYSSRHAKKGKTIDFSVTFHISCEYSRLDVSARVSGGKSTRIMLYIEPIMQEEGAYLAHRSFSGLFLEGEHLKEEKALVISRRPRSEAKYLYLGITESSGADFDCETGRDELAPGYSQREIAELIFSPCCENFSLPMIPACRATVQKASRADFAIGFSSDKDDLLYYLHRGEKSDDASLLHLQHGAARIGKSASSLESFILRSIFFPKAEHHAFDKATMMSLCENPVAKSDFYRFSLSCDNPTVEVRFFRMGGRSSDNIRMLLALFRYACIRGLRYDFVIVYSENDVYRKTVRKHLLRLITESGCENFIAVPCGIYLINAGELRPGEEYALGRMACVTVDSTFSLQATVRSNRYYFPLSRGLEARIVKPPESKIIPCEKPKIEVIEATLTGDFHREGFLADKRKISVPYANVVSSRAFGFVSTQNSAGFTFSTNSALGKLTPHTADSLREDSCEKLILRVFCAFGDDYRDYDLCACSAYVDYRRGKTVYYGAVEGISYRVEICIGEKLAVKYFDVYTDLNSRKIKAEVIFSVKSLLGSAGDDMRGHILVCDSENIALKIFPIFRTETGRKMAVMSGSAGEVYTDDAALACEGRAFFGMEDVAAIKCGAENGRNSFAIAAFRGDADYEYIRNEFLSGIRPCPHASFVPEAKIESGDALFDLFVNEMIPYQTVTARLVARCGFYQVGGAYGFRDQLQDCLSLGDAELRLQLIFCACHQYYEGDVMHWWHNVGKGRGHMGIRTRCSDDCAWLVFAFLEYLDRSGDDAFAKEKFPFLISSPLDKNERERYEFALFCDEKFEMSEHIFRAAERLCTKGKHGLALIGSHDWNDALNGVGLDGESVWLSQFSAHTLERLSDFCRRIGESEKAVHFAEESKRLFAAVEEYGFDGDRYLRGFYPSGEVLGGRAGDECQIDVLPQAFAVFCGCDEHRAEVSVMTAERLLFDEKSGVFRLLFPPFDKCGKNPGYIKGYVPGTRENGGQYTHAAVWGAMALILSGNEEDGVEILKRLSPPLRSRDAALAEKYRIEPFVLAGDVYASEGSLGRGGWSWYTGSAGWYRTAVISCVCGYHRRDGGFYLSPHLSSKFPCVTLHIERNGTRYKIKISKTGKRTLILDGEEILRKDGKIEDTTFFFCGGEHEITAEI